MIPEKYWSNIIRTMIEEKLIAGITYTSSKNGIVFSNLGNAEITFKGMGYPFENSLMQKAKDCGWYY